MSSSIKTILSVVVSIFLAGYLVYWVSTSISWEDSKVELANAKYVYALLSLLLGAVAYWLRSQRWRLLLEPLGYKVSGMTAWSAVSVNYMMNLLIPRSGEIARCGAIFKSDAVPVDESLGTVVVERVIDFICLFTVMALALVTNYELIIDLLQSALEMRSKQSDGNASATFFTAFTAFAGVCIGVLVLLLLFWRKIVKSKIGQKALEFLKGIRKGFKSVFQLKKQGLFWLYTLLIWVFYYLMTYLVVFCFEGSSHIDPLTGLFLLVAGGVGMVIPASGGIGSYHAALSLAFISLGLSGELGTAFALIIHTPHTLLALIFGFVGFIWISKKGKKNKTSRI